MTIGQLFIGQVRCRQTSAKAQSLEVQRIRQKIRLKFQSNIKVNDLSIAGSG